MGPVKKYREWRQAKQEGEQKRKLLAKTRRFYVNLADELENKPIETIKLVNDTLEEHADRGNTAFHLARTIYSGLLFNVLNEKNLPQTLPLLRQTFHEYASQGGSYSLLGETIRKGFEHNAFNAQNLAQVLLVLREHAKHGHNTYELASTVSSVLSTPTRVFKAETENQSQLLALLHEDASHGHKTEKLMTEILREFEREAIRRNPQLLKEALEHAKQGANAAPIMVFAAKKPEKLEAASAARKHLIKAAEFLHDVEEWKDHEKVSVPLFDHVIKTYKTLLPKIGEKAYWQHVKIYANQLKANKTSVKVT